MDVSRKLPHNAQPVLLKLHQVAATTTERRLRVQVGSQALRCFRRANLTGLGQAANTRFPLKHPGPIEQSRPPLAAACAVHRLPSHAIVEHHA